MEAVPVENLIYARSMELMQVLFPEFDAKARASGVSWERENEELDEPFHPRVRMRRAIAMVEDGEVAAGIAEAEKALELHPSEVALRGHLAHWLAWQGNRAEAARHYRVIISEQPDNEEARRLLAGLEQECSPDSAPRRENA
jgi:hypothetical protein